jgi:ABC-type uncharacterized transport system YnjBCD permease subunit
VSPSVISAMFMFMSLMSLALVFIVYLDTYLVNHLTQLDRGFKMRIPGPTKKLGSLGSGSTILPFLECGFTLFSIDMADWCKYVTHWPRRPFRCAAAGIKIGY